MSKIGYEAIENASIDEIRQLQLQRLKATLQHAYNNSPVYRKKFDDHGVHPDDLHSLKDLGKFPFTTKADLRDNYPFGMFCTPMDQIVRIHASSGTTGKPTVVGYTQNDINTWATTVARSIYAAGGRPGDKVHVAYGYGLFTGGLGAHYGAEKLGCAVIPMSGGQTEKQVQLIRDFDPDIIMVTPSYMLNICDEIARQGIDPKDLALRVGIFGAEPWTNAMRQDIETRMVMDAVDIYGLSEVMGPGVAQECVETKDGPVIWEDHYYPEIINPETGEVLPDGEEGELVFTNLTKEGMPMIRYRTRDLTRLLPGTSRSMRRMDKITGRSDDMLIIRGVNVFPTQIEEQILSVDKLSPHYLIEVNKQGNMDQVTINIEPNNHLSSRDEDSITRDLQHKVKTMIGISSKIVVHRPGELPRSEGKAKRVIDNRKLNAFRDSVQRCLAKPEFIETFYDAFIGVNEEVAKLFEKTDMNKQRDMLKSSLLILMTTTMDTPETRAHLEHIAKSHSRSGHNVRPELYSLWLDCLIAAARQHDHQFEPSIEKAWRDTLSSGIETMKANY